MPRTRDSVIYGHWTAERLKSEARRWHDLTGVWPVSTDWHATVGGPGGSDSRRDAVLEFRSVTGPWPFVGTVSDMFGTWGAFMAAVGGVAPGNCQGVKHGSREAVIRAAIARLQDP